MSEEKKLIKIDFGCGQRKASPEHVGVDFVPIEGVDVVHDLTKFPYPFEDESAEEIYASHFFEHLDGHERARFMEECYRILISPQKDEYGNITKVGKMRLIHPYSKSDRFYQDFTHKWPPINQNSYLYFNKDWREQNLLTHGYYDLKCNFKLPVINCLWQDPTVAAKNEETRNFMMDKMWNVIADIVVDLEKQ